MKIENEFSLPLPKSKAWPMLLDVEMMASALPGAELLEKVDDKTFRGRVSVKLGPVSLAFLGTAEILEADEVAAQIRIKGSGSDSKGRGRASATFDIRLSEVGPNETVVRSVTDVALTGAVASYGRASGLMTALSEEIISQFMARLRELIDAERTAEAVPGAAPVAPAMQPGPVSPVRRSRDSGGISGFRLATATLRRWARQMFRKAS